MRRWLLVLGLLLLPALSVAQAIQPLPFRNHAEEVRFQQLSAELRCPMCQNETLADSNAPIAHDLRRQVFEMMQAGKSDDEIKAFLVDRYSQFVLYKPPVEPSTWLLWFGPLALLAIGGIVVAVQVRRRARQSPADTTPINDTGDDW
ncbi:cytochrome c-type biogenesis protein CcmH [Luteibacter sp. OK325]|jgi:cytochrome c-type biogenesis protein CcmH|uniref:cytochrome c-type biogenesis protein n=1 Tax=Luteibacter sp. OK325 TaxID=2135670 RepID=UPI000D3D7797|nr:cytochrome c-type biogenesis protein [Luteibacter sp. OK325]PTR30102.1 cytochrome c-type biogenesis protein CcmH [Luteibacter sp. OK325]